VLSKFCFSNGSRIIPRYFHPTVGLSSCDLGYVIDLRFCTYFSTSLCHRVYPATGCMIEGLSPDRGLEFGSSPPSPDRFWG